MKSATYGTFLNRLVKFVEYNDFFNSEFTRIV
jgi:hypothetical protein